MNTILKTAIFATALLARPSDAGEKRQRYAYDKGAGAGNNEECQSPVYPCFPSGFRPEYKHSDHRRNYGKGNGGGAYCRCIYPREF